LAIERRLPVMMHSRQTAQDGALMSYAPSIELIMRRTAITGGRFHQAYVR
jgi:hypothetical protein